MDDETVRLFRAMVVPMALLVAAIWGVVLWGESSALDASVHAVEALVVALAVLTLRRCG